MKRLFKIHTDFLFGFMRTRLQKLILYFADCFSLMCLRRMSHRLFIGFLLYCECMRVIVENVVIGSARIAFISLLVVCVWQRLVSLLTWTNKQLNAKTIHIHSCARILARIRMIERESTTLHSMFIYAFHLLYSKQAHLLEAWSHSKKAKHRSSWEKREKKKKSKWRGKYLITDVQCMQKNDYCTVQVHTLCARTITHFK